MDLYVERQCVEQMKAGQGKQFLLLFDAYFEELYKYVARRVHSRQEVERIVRLTFLDALGQIQSTPQDVGYSVWLYSLARPRVWDAISKESFSQSQKAETKDFAEEKEDIKKVQKMFNKLSLEEREILRLKFFEQLTDGDVMTVLDSQEGVIGPKIYRVLKRAYFLLFGETEESQEVYFGELSGYLSKVAKIESIESPEVFRLGLRADLQKRIDRKDFAINGDLVEDKEERVPVRPVEGKGSDDPAKVFVEAVKEMKKEEEEEILLEQKRIERMERFHEFFDKWKHAIVLIPALIFTGIIVVAIFNFVDFQWKLKRGYPNDCTIQVGFDGEFTDAERRGVDEWITNRICNHFDVNSLQIVKTDKGKVDVEVDLEGKFLVYSFIQKEKIWKIKKYARTFDSNQQSGEVSGNS